MKNILLIGVDQLRWDAVGPNKTIPTNTPNIDALIAGGVSFSRAYATSPLCTPSRASMFTGDYAFTHGMGTNCDMYHALAKELPNPDRLLHHDLTRAGYRCGFVGKWHVGTVCGPNYYGFEGEDIPGYGNLATSDSFLNYLSENNLEYSVEPTLYFNPDQQTMSGGRWKGPIESTPVHFLTNQTMDMLDEFNSGDDSFFITAQFWDPHGPHLVSNEYYGSTDRSAISAWANFSDDLSGKPARVKRERDDFYRLHPRSEEELIEYIGLYCDHIAMLDYEIGRLMDHLGRRGILEDTLIIFTSDHGDMTGAHGGLIDKGLLYEEAMRVPLVFSHPSLVSGARDGLALNMDVLPTAMRLVGVDFEPRQAVDLTNQITDENAEARKYLLAEFHGLRFLYSQRMLVSDDGWKFIFSPGDYDELYNLNDDPHEMHNLVDAPDAVDRIWQMRQAMMDETANANDPLRDCVAKFNGQWRTNSRQFDATSAYLKP
ncbi:MAG: sulfatase-like hydrolase/transferase [Paracoccaceae bacterium]